MVKFHASDLASWVRFPLPAPYYLLHFLYLKKWSFYLFMKTLKSRIYHAIICAQLNYLAFSKFIIDFLASIIIVTGGDNFEHKSAIWNWHSTQNSWIWHCSLWWSTSLHRRRKNPGSANAVPRHRSSIICSDRYRKTTAEMGGFWIIDCQ